MRTFAVAVCLILLPLGLPAADEELAQRLLSELIASNTAPSGGPDISPAITMLASELRAAGFASGDLAIVGPEGAPENLVVRLRSPRATARPILLMAHLDVVEALRQDWSFEPYALVERDGFFYGRGTVDNKTGAAIIVASLIRLKQEGYRGNRDLIAMLTGDEESTGDGARWLATDGRELIDAEFALNSDAGFIALDGEARTAFVLQTGEKVYVSYRLQALDPGGHSSLPRPDNPIYRLSRALAAQQKHRFPIDLNDTTRAFFAARAEIAEGDERRLLDALAAGDFDAPALAGLPDHPYYNAVARTTCVATELAGGHAENALPQTATAVINCRVLPQADVADVEASLRQLADPFGVSVSPIAPANPSPPSPLTREVIEPIEAVAAEMWPGIRLVPEMSTGATDGLFVRAAGIPVYGVSAIAEDPDELRAHGKDERIAIESFNDALRYWYRLLRRLTDDSQPRPSL